MRFHGREVDKAGYLKRSTRLLQIIRNTANVYITLLKKGIFRREKRHVVHEIHRDDLPDVRLQVHPGRWEEGAE